MNKWEKLDDDGCLNLISAVIKQAIDDYKFALKILQKRPNSRAAKEDIAELQTFFRSTYFSNISAVDGEYLIEKIERDFQDEQNRKNGNSSGKTSGWKRRAIKATSAKTGEVITFESAAEAAKEMHIDRWSILQALSKQRTLSCDYSWEYIEV